MQFSISTVAAAAAVLFSGVAAATNTVTFKSLDDTSRTIIFTPSSGYSSIDSVTVSGGASVDVTIPDSWIGNWYSRSDGAANTDGMLGEVSFQGWNGITYFDVSAIVNASDFDGVHEMYPVSASTPVSGCATFPCDNAYYMPDDVQTKTTTETSLVCTLGANGSSKKARDVESFPRDYVTSGPKGRSTSRIMRRRI